MKVLFALLVSCGIYASQHSEKEQQYLFVETERYCCNECKGLFFSKEQYHTHVHASLDSSNKLIKIKSKKLEEKVSLPSFAELIQSLHTMHERKECAQKLMAKKWKA